MNFNGGNMNTLNHGNVWYSLALYVIVPPPDDGEHQEAARVQGVDKMRLINKTL
jgi:hypothetical protein